MKALIRIKEPGSDRVRQIGKFVPINGKHVYVYDLKPSDNAKLREIDAYGVAPCVLKEMLALGIDEIHYCDRKRGVTLISTPQQVLAEGIPLKGVRRSATYIHLPCGKWKERHWLLNYPRTNLGMSLTWIEPEDVMPTIPVVEQMSLFAD